MYQFVPKYGKFFQANVSILDPITIEGLANKDYKGCGEVSSVIFSFMLKRRMKRIRDFPNSETPWDTAYTNFLVNQISDEDPNALTLSITPYTDWYDMILELENME